MVSPKITHVLNREKGQFPMSIATSLAFESLLNIHPDTKHDRPQLHRFDTIWINIRTLFRNMYTSMARLTADTLEYQDLAHGLLDDIEQINDFAREYNKPVFYYLSHYNNFDTKYKFAKLRLANTVIQKVYMTKMSQVFTYLFKNKILIDTKEGNGNIFVYNDIIRPTNHPSVGMITHYCYDLLDSYSFSKLVLLETHTGRLKEKEQWYTKYYNSSELPPLPFRLDLLQIFGDKEMFSPAPKNIRDIFLKAAKQYEWTPMTTSSRIIQSLEALNYYDVSMHYRNILSTSKI